jgi:hypothetical protein
MMHADLVQTHIISIIYHIDRSEDAEPWPLYIEDFHGRTHEVYLTSGDLLFYESAKCLHGRPKPLRGSWYSSVFVHYRPVGWSDADHKEAARNALPPNWEIDPDPNTRVEHELMALRGTCLMELNCPNYWCRSNPGTTVKWGGPGKEQVWIDPEFNEHSFHPSKTPRVRRSMCDPEKSELTEIERGDCYSDRNYTWPPPRYVPETLGWRKLMQNRIEQIEAMPDAAMRYQAYQYVVKSAFLVPNFTEYGFGLTRAPDELASLVKKSVHNLLLDATEGEGDWLQINVPELVEQTLEELRPYAEAWTQQMLVPSGAYGVTLDRNQSYYTMTLDDVQTEVISIIFHVDSSYDAEPWPIYIEDFNGLTHEISLAPGDLLMYEGAKCLYGRPKKFSGSWHATIVAHYLPAGGWSEVEHDKESLYAVPLTWAVNPKLDKPQKHERLEMTEEAFTEPDCVNWWCNSKGAIPWIGPAKKDVWIDPQHNDHPLDLKQASVLSEL